MYYSSPQVTCIHIISIAACDLAKDADVAIVLVASYASEGSDRESLAFEADVLGYCQLAAPGQDSLVSAVAGTGVDVIVAATAPGAILTPWREEVKVTCCNTLSRIR